MPSAQSKLDILITAKDSASGPIKQIEGSLKGLDQSASTLAKGLTGVLAGAGIAGIGALVTDLGSAAVEMAKTAAETERLGTAFDQMAKQAGTSGDAMLAAMQKASNGTISNADLMASANRAMLLGVADSSDKMGQLLEVAAARGKAMGETTGQAFSDLVTGIGRMSPMILDNLGITLDAKQVFDEYAKSIGTTADKLDDGQRKQALLNAVIKDSADLVKQNKQAGGDLADNFERMDAALSNAKDSLGKLFAPAVAVIAQKIADAAGSAAEALQAIPQQTQAQQLEQTLQHQNNLLADMEASGEKGTLAYQNLAQGAADTKVALDALGGAFKNAGTSSYDLWIAEQNANTATQAAAIAAYQAARAKGVEADQTGRLTDEIHALTAASDAARQALAGIQSQAIGALQSAAEQAVPILGAQKVSQMYDERKKKLNEQIEILTRYGYSTDQARFKSLELEKAAAEPFTTAVEAAKEAEQANNRAAKSVDTVSQAYEDLHGKVASVLQSALNVGVGVDPQKVLESMGFPREDAINENARRLADIAQNGLKNQDWLGQFQQQVPDIWKMIRLAQNPQEEAARLLQDFQDGLLTSPIDKDKAKEIVRRQIMGDQNMADFANQIAQELATEMGVPLQEAMAATQKTLGGGQGLGSEAASQFADGASAALDEASGGGGGFVSKFSDQMRASYPLLSQAGKDAGRMWGAGFLETVGAAVPPALIKILVDLVSPGVMASMAQKASLTGAVP